MTVPPIMLFTDFSWQGPYVGQMIAAIAATAGETPVISLMHDAPRMRPDLAAYLLAAVARDLPDAACVVAVVDPGVGSARRPLIVETDRATFVGPDNGLMSRLPGIVRVSVIDWQPSRLSATFHGRDLFAPVAARLATTNTVPKTPAAIDDMVGADWPMHRDEIVYIDGYGNLMVGRMLEDVSEINGLRIGDEQLTNAGTFSDVPAGGAFWYRNSLGLLEIAVNGGSAAERFGLALGDKILLS